MAFSSFCGRYLERNFGSLIVLILPVLALLVAGFVLALWRWLRGTGRAESSRMGELWLFHLTYFLSGLLLTESLITTPIERMHLATSSALGAALFFSLATLKGPKRFLTAAVLVFAICLGEEILQILIPDRVFDLHDIALNAIGGLFGLLYGGGLEHLLRRGPDCRRG